MIYHLSYKIDNGRKQHIYAIKKICEKKKKALQAKHGENIKFSRITIP
jgi:hypothetical protein